MARSRVAEAAPDRALRSRMVKKLRDFAARYSNAENPGPFEPTGYVDKAGRLDRGERVAFRGWELPAKTLPPGHAYDWFLLEPDDSLTPVDPIRRDDQIIGWRRIDGGPDFIERAS